MTPHRRLEERKRYRNLRGMHGDAARRFAVPNGRTVHWIKWLWAEAFP